jgi:Ca-activated chloride channel family protein
MKHFTQYSIALFILLIITASFSAQTTFYTFQGEVKLAKSNSTIDGVLLTLKNNATKKLVTTKSNTKGVFKFSNIENGFYSLKIEKKGFITKLEKNIKISKDELAYHIELTPEIIEVEIEDIEVIEYEEVADYMVAPKISEKRMESKMRMSSGITSNWSPAPVVHNTESYSPINENIFKLVKTAPLSTFSIDVDVAAYANMRRFLTNGNKVPEDAVRIEEFINYFDYEYPKPQNKQPFSITTELGVCPWNSNNQLVHIGLQGEKIELENLPANNLVFLLDVSGSMNYGNKLPLLKQSLKLLINNLRKEDKIGIVVYAGAAGVVLEPTSDKEAILSALEKLSAGGSTAGGEGIKAAYKLAEKNFIENGNNRIILATDGDFNVGAGSDGAMKRLIEEKRETGVSLTCLGFGMGNYKDSKMEVLSNYGNGNYAYIDNLLEAKKVLVTEMGGTLVTIAKDVKIQVEFNPELVASYRLVGYENRLLNNEDFNDDKKDAGEIGAGHAVTALYEIIPAGGQTTGSVDDLKYQKNDTKTQFGDELLTVKFRYKEPKESTSKLITLALDAHVSPREYLSENYLFSAAVAEFGMLLRNSKFKEGASFESVLSLAKENIGKDENGYRAEFIRLVSLAKEIYKVG